MLINVINLELLRSRVNFAVSKVASSSECSL